MRRRSRARLATALALVSCLAGLAPSAASATTRTVEMRYDYAFHAATVSVARGDTVRWKNTGSLPHDVRSDLPGYFKSPGGNGGLDAPGDTYTRTFKQAGSFGYVCRFHEADGMRGSVTVPLKVTLSGSTFTITVASATASGEWRNRTQVRRSGASSWTTLATTTARSVTYRPSRGTYSFRSAVRNKVTGAQSGWSPSVTRTR